MEKIIKGIKDLNKWKAVQSVDTVQMRHSCKLIYKVDTIYVLKTFYYKKK